MLDSPDSLYASFRIGLVSCLAFGGILSIPSIWLKLFPIDKDGIPLNNGGLYLKSGEYGESEFKSSTWSVFKEPLNAWTSLSYSLFGIVISITGCCDYISNMNGELMQNTMMRNSIFSITLGSFCIYLGISSFLFHASHTESWRKADAGMTSGIALPLILFAIWDRSPPPYLSASVMIFFSNILLFSLTHGFVPYGSSDILLPVFIIFIWIVELVPYFGGVVSTFEYYYWLCCLYAVLGGALLRAIDIKRNNVNVRNILISIYFIMTGLFGYWLGFTSSVIIFGAVAGLITSVQLYRGHIFWHFASSYAVYIWWYMLRIRPGDPMLGVNWSTNIILEYNILTIILLLCVKNGIRRLLMMMPDSILSLEYRDRLRALAEHVFFAAWGYYVIIKQPTVLHSWFMHPALSWYRPATPSEEFELYYLAKVASYLEDLLFLWVTGTTYSKEVSVQTDAYGNPVASTRSRKTIPLLHTPIESKNSENMRSFHHNLAALLAVTSFISGYTKIGSLVMFTHDLSDCFMDIFRILDVKGWRKLQLFFTVITVPIWFYYRIWYFISNILYSIAYESKPMKGTEMNCELGMCTFYQVIDRIPFLIVLITVLILNIITLLRLFRKGLRIIFPLKANNSIN